MYAGHWCYGLAGAHNALYYPWLTANFGNRPPGLNGYKTKWCGYHK